MVAGARAGVTGVLTARRRARIEGWRDDDGATDAGGARLVVAVRAWVGSALMVSLMLGVQAAPAGAVGEVDPLARACFGRTPTIVDNGPGDQDPRQGFILGTPGPDVIITAIYGADVDGGEGDDVICMGEAPDGTARGGPGNDTLVCGWGIDCDGGPGDDDLCGF